MALYLHKDGNDVYTIDDNWSFDGVNGYTWNVPSDVSDDNGYRIKVRSHDTGAYDISDGTFTINNDASQPYLHLDTPNGGEVLQIGTEHNISFTAPNHAGNAYTLELWNGDGTYNSIIENNVDLNDRIYNWLIPEVAPGSYFVRIASTQAAISGDFSDNVFFRSHRSNQTNSRFKSFT